MTSTQSKSVVRILLKSVNAALASIDKEAPISDDVAHDVRKQLKRARATLRLLRPSLGDNVCHRENRTLRDVSRIVSPLRDARAQVDVLDALRERHPRRLSPDELAPLSTVLLKRLGQVRRRVGPSSTKIRGAIRNLKASRRRLRNHCERESTSQDVAAGLRKVYQRAQRAYEAAKANPTAETLHAWRKETKYLYNAVDSLDVPEGSRPALASKQAHRLGDWLGEDHDLVVLSETVDRQADASSPSVRRDLQAAIQDRFVKLSAKSLRLGAKTFARSPRKAVARA